MGLVKLPKEKGVKPVDFDIRESIQSFLKCRGLRCVIGFSGGSEENEERVTPIVESAIAVLAVYPVAILTGGTTWSVPNIANDAALRAGLSTIGVLPERGQKYLNCQVNLPVVVQPRVPPSEWGDDSEVFAKLVNGMIMIGGGYAAIIRGVSIVNRYT